VFLKQLIRRNWRTVLIVMAFTTDIVVIMLSGFLAYIVRGFIPHLSPFPSSIFFQFVGTFGLALLILAMIIGVYRATSHSNMNRQYFLTIRIYFYAILCLFSFLYVFQTDAIPRRFIFLFVFILPFVFFLGRMLLNVFIHFMQRRGYGIHNVILAGYDNGGLAIIHRFKNFPELGYDIKGIVTNQKNNILTPIEIHGTPVPRYPISKLKHIVSEYQIDRVFVPSQETITNGYSEIFKLCKENRIKLKVLSEDSDSLLRLSRVYDIAGITLYTPERRRIHAAKRLLKRIFDIIGSLFVLLVFGPLLLIVALSIWLEDGTPIIFQQTRALAKGKKEFKILKFRSMKKDAELEQSEMYAFNEVPGGLFRVEKDSRVTRVGKLIRKLSIDEMPQFINVLIGDMSIVGPRPLSIADLDNIEPANQMSGLYAQRSQGKPGITGLWQISGRRDIDFREMVYLDLYYLENQSLLFDLEIIFATIPVVLFGKGAY
jgi:exopolysaccharide biosynthesis polyprenyl glycosylphosphotransferase